MKKTKSSPRNDREFSMKETAEQIIKEISNAERIMNAIGDGVSIVDRAFNVLYENQVYKDMLGDQVGRRCYSAYTRKKSICDGCPVALTFKDGAVHTVLREIRTDKGISYIEITASPFKNSMGEIIAGIEILRDITDRKKAEAAVIESEWKLKNIIEHSRELYYIHDTHNVLSYVSPQSLQILGYTPVEMMIAWTRLATENPINEKGIGATEKALKTGERQEPYLLELYRKDGKKALLDIYESPVKDRKGNVIGIIGAARDVTERKQAEIALQYSEERYRSTINFLDDALHVADKDLTIILANKKLLEWHQRFGIGEDVIGNNIFQVYAFLPETVREEYRSVFQAGIPITTEETIRIHGKEVITETKKMPIFEGSNVVKVITIIRDITKRKEAEEALRASEAELHANYFAQSAINMILSESLENIPLEESLQKALNIIISIPWIAFEAIGSISLVDDKTDSLVMKAQSNLPGPLKELCARVPFGKCLCGKAAEGQKIQFAGHIDERHEICYEGMVPHGHYSVPILSGGRTLGVLNIYLKEGHRRNQKEEEFLNTVANTLTGIIVQRKAEKEKEKLHDQLLQAQKMEAVGQLSGGIAHDFNNILTAIIGYGNLLKMEVEKDTTLSTYTKYILDSAERAAKLTQDLLAFSRKQVISPKPINVNDVIKGVEKILQRLISEDIELSISLSDKDLIVMADSTQLEHVLMNLATNARDAMPEGGSLFIRSDSTEMDDRFISMYGYGEKGRYAVIIVSDTGAGIDEQIKEKIFEPFFTTKEVGKGTGLGLAMVYGIVKQHNGFINVYSEPGKGTTFKMYLPLIHATIADAKEIALPISKRGIETVLIAEDDALVRKFMREVLEDAGYTVIEAADGRDAIKAFNENKERIKLLILDVIMPKKNGKEVYETLKESTPSLKALFTSGYSADIIHKKGIIGEGPEVMLKPVSADKLLRKIRDLLDQ